jgi:hypothetical protein
MGDYDRHSFNQEVYAKILPETVIPSSINSEHDRDIRKYALEMAAKNAKTTESLVSEARKIEHYILFGVTE